MLSICDSVTIPSTCVVVIAMSLDPSYSSPKLEFDPDPLAVESESKLPKPGKWFGIIALLCGAEGVLAILLGVLTEIFYISVIANLDPLNEFLWYSFVVCLICISPFCAVAGIVFGILGRNTQGRSYAYTGLALCVLYGMVAFSIFVFSALVPCC